MFRANVQLKDFFDPDELLERFGLQPGGRVQHAVNEGIITYSKQGGYVPASPRRTLEDSAVADDMEGWVAWNTPYAHYQHEGIVFSPSIPDIDPETGVLLGFWSPPGRPKRPTDRKLTYDKAQNPNAGPFWVQRMMADHKKDILRLANAAMEGRR